VAVERDHLSAVVALAGVAEADLDRSRLRGLGGGHALLARLDLEHLGLAARPVVIVVAAGGEAEREHGKQQGEKGGHTHRESFRVVARGTLAFMDNRRPFGLAWPSARAGNM
jgi:hypothetical protein